MTESKIKNPTSLKNIGNVYWWSGSWTCPADGIVNVQISWNTSSGNKYFYVKDTTSQIRIAAIYDTGYNGTYSNMMFVAEKGHSYTTESLMGAQYIQCYYYQFT